MTLFWKGGRPKRRIVTAGKGSSEQDAGRNGSMASCSTMLSGQPKSKLQGGQGNDRGSRFVEGRARPYGPERGRRTPVRRSHPEGRRCTRRAREDPSRALEAVPGA